MFVDIEASKLDFLADTHADRELQYQEHNQGKDKRKPADQTDAG